MAAKFFSTSMEWRTWLKAHHALESELIVGFYKRSSGRPSMTWPESVDEALCFGWIDGIRRRIDEESYSIRFTPRRTHSIWSLVNVRRVGELTNIGMMEEAGVRAFAARTDERTGIYAFERVQARLSQAQEEKFKINAIAWGYFVSQPPWYQKTALFWIVSAKRLETQEQRLSILIMESAEERHIASLRREQPKKRPLRSK